MRVKVCSLLAQDQWSVDQYAVVGVLVALPPAKLVIDLTLPRVLLPA